MRNTRICAADVAMLVALVPRRRAGLAGQDGQDHGAVRARLDARHRGAADRRPAAGKNIRAQPSWSRTSRARAAITGTDAVAKAAPDGTTIGISIGGPLAINTLLFSKMPYDPGKDIAPVTQLVTMPSALAVNPSLSVNSVAELVALLKREPGKYNFGSIGNGSLSHLAMEAIALKSGAKLVHVPYRARPPR